MQPKATLWSPLSPREDPREPQLGCSRSRDTGRPLLPAPAKPRPSTAAPLSSFPVGLQAKGEDGGVGGTCATGEGYL